MHLLGRFVETELKQIFKNGAVDVLLTCCESVKVDHRASLLASCRSLCPRRVLAKSSRFLVHAGLTVVPGVGRIGQVTLFLLVHFII